jgi:hypothetical protein
MSRRPPGEFLDLLTVNGASQDRRAGPVGLSERFQPEDPDRLVNGLNAALERSIKNGPGYSADITMTQ